MCGGDGEFSVWEGSSPNVKQLLNSLSHFYELRSINMFVVKLLQRWWCVSFFCPPSLCCTPLCCSASWKLCWDWTFLWTSSAPLVVPSASLRRDVRKTLVFWRVNMILPTLQDEVSKREEHRGSLREGGFKNKVISRPLFFIVASKSRSSPLSLER